MYADTAVHANDREGLERLLRYGARGPVAESRLRLLEDGRYEYTPKKGVAFTLTAEALVRRLVALVPPPKRHLTSFHGVLAPNARHCTCTDLGTRREGEEAEAPARLGTLPPDTTSTVRLPLRPPLAFHGRLSHPPAPHQPTKPAAARPDPSTRPVISRVEPHVLIPRAGRFDFIQIW